MALDRVGNLRMKGNRVPRLRLLAEPCHDRGDVAGATLTKSKEQAQQRILQLRVDAGNNSQIEQGELAVGGQQQVPRMRIGVEEAVDKDLIEVAIEQLISEGVPVGLLQGQGPERADVAALDELH